MEYSKEDLMEAKKQIWGVGENMGTEESKKIWEENAQFWDNAMGDESNEFGNVKKCAVGKHPKSEKLGGIGSGCRLRLRPLPVLHRRQSQRVARIDPNAVVVDKNIAENDRFDLFSR